MSDAEDSGQRKSPEFKAHCKRNDGPRRDARLESEFGKLSLKTDRWEEYTAGCVRTIIVGVE